MLMPRVLRDRQLRKQVAPREGELDGVRVRAAESARDLERCLALVHDEYARRGITSPHASGVHLTPHLMLPSTFTFMAEKDGQVIGTVSLVRDSQLGLPLDALYPYEMARLRATRIAEVSAQAVAPAHRGRGVTYLLNKMIFGCALGLGDDLVIGVHPRATDYYRATLNFRQAGPVRDYPGLRDAPCTLLHFATRWTWRAAKGCVHPPERDCQYRLAHLWRLRTDTEIDWPSDVALLTSARMRRRTAARLSALRPDTIEQLPAKTAGALAQVLPGVQLPVDVAAQLFVEKHGLAGAARAQGRQ
jgi:hypothetical protein